MFSESLFKSLVDNSPNLISVVNDDFTYDYINPAVTKYTGLLPDAIIGRHMNSFFWSVENYNELYDQICSYKRDSKPSTIELKNNSLIGIRFFNVQVSGSITKQNEQKFFVVARDTTDLKLKQTEIERKQNYIITSAEALLQPFVVLNPYLSDEGEVIDFVYEYANEAASKSNNIPNDAMLGERVLKLFPLHKDNGVFDNLKKVYLTGESWRDVVYYYGPAGEKILMGIFEISAAKIHNGIVATWNNITHLKTTEEKLRRSEKKFNLAFHNNPAAMVISRFNGELVEINKAYEKIFGFSREELIGMKSTDTGVFADKRDRELLIKILQKDGEIRNLEFELRNKKKESIFALLSISPIDMEDEPYLLSVIVDVTDQRKLESSLQDMLREKVILLQEVHHRVRNNMQIILSMLNLQRNSITDSLLNDQLLAAQNRIRSMALVYDKLFPADTYSTINLKQYLSALVSESVDSLFSPEVNLSFSNIDNLSIDIEYAIKIGLIINELFTNSIKHAFNQASSGKINLDIKKIDSQLLIGYSDNGIGFPLDFDHKQPNSLGLKLIHILVDDLNGTFEHHRTRHRTAFNITLKMK